MDIAALKTLNRLVEHVLDLAPSERTTWVESLGPEYEAFKPRLKAMLDRIDSTGEAGFLASLPAFDVTAGAGDPSGAAFAAGAVVGRYRLVREIAAGGQGSVWLAERIDGLVDRPVAVKMPVGLAFRPGLADRMAREREILARLTHPHIARLYDAGVTDLGAPFLALEYVDGLPIDRYVAERRLDVGAILRLFLQVADAVTYAHGQLVIHRDLKPSNVLVTPEGQVRLLDFGIAKLMDDAPGRDSTMTVVGGRALTLAYASPEQITQATLGVATDVYSLGVVLYELLCGRRPHVPARDTSGSLEDAILHDEPPLASQAAVDASRRPLLRGDLDTILAKALKKQPGDRYPTVAAFGDDLARHLDGRPVSAQPDSRAYRTRKFVARHRLAVGAGAAVLAAIVGGAGVALWQARVARVQRDRADAVKEFVTSIFRDIDPYRRGEGRPLTATDVLTEARQRLDTTPTLAAEPAVRAELLRVLGTSFVGVGEATHASEVLTRALPEVIASDGALSDEAISTEIALARATYLVGKIDEANAHLDNAERALTQSGRRDTETFVDMALLRSEVVINKGGFRTPEADTTTRAALEAATRILPAVHPKRASALQRMSAVYRWQDKYKESAQMADEAYRMQLDVQRGDTKHISVVMAENELGRALFQVGRTKEAIEHLKAAAANGAVSLADDAMLRQHLLGTLANVQLAYGEIKDAITNFETAMALDLKGVTLSPSYIASQHGVRARAYLAGRRFDDAVAAYTQALEATRTGSDAGITAAMTSERAEALVRLGRAADARADVTPLLAGRSAKMTPVVRRAVWLQGEMHRLAGEYPRALALLNEAVDFTPQNGRSSLDKASFQVSLGRLLLSMRRLDDAQKVLDEARATYAANQGVMTPSHAEVLVALADVHAAGGRAADARALVAQASAFWQAFDATHPEAVAVAARARALAITPRATPPGERGSTHAQGPRG